MTNKQANIQQTHKHRNKETNDQISEHTKQHITKHMNAHGRRPRPPLTITNIRGDKRIDTQYKHQESKQPNKRE